MYHAELGRFVSRDPIGYDAGDDNLYRYALGNPPRWADPYGLEKEDPQQTRDAQLTAACRKYYEEDVRRDRAFQKCWQAVVSRASTLPEKEGEKCKGLKFECGCCYKLGIKGVVAFYSPKHHSIAICAEDPSVAGRNTAVIAQALCHEIVHVLQSAPCHPNPWERTCTNDIMREIQGYYCTGSCTTARTCTDKGVASTKANPSTPCKEGQPTQEQLREILTWANDHIKKGTMCRGTGIDPSLF